MPTNSVLYGHLQDRIGHALDNSSFAMGRGDHWTIKCGPDKLPINLLVEDIAEKPVIFVFDPHDPDESVMRMSIQEVEEIDEFIDAMGDRVVRARSFMDAGRDLSIELHDHLVTHRVSGVHPPPPHRHGR